MERLGAPGRGHVEPSEVSACRAAVAGHGVGGSRLEHGDILNARSAILDIRSPVGHSQTRVRRRRAPSRTTAAGSFHQASLDDLGRPLAEVTFCVIDLETTVAHRRLTRSPRSARSRCAAASASAPSRRWSTPDAPIPPHDHRSHRHHRVDGGAGPPHRAVLASLLEFSAARSSSATTPASTSASSTPHSNATDGRGSATRPSTPPPWPAGCCATRCPTAGSARWPNASARPPTQPPRPRRRARHGRSAAPPVRARHRAFGVLGLDDLRTLPRLAGHPQAAKLRLTAGCRAPRASTCSAVDGRVLYVGKATNLRARVRSTSPRTSDGRSGSAPRDRTHRPQAMWTEFEAAVLEARLIRTLLPTYNRPGSGGSGRCTSS